MSAAGAGAAPGGAGRVRVHLPGHLRELAGTGGPEVAVSPAAGSEATLAAVLDALEARYPVLRGTIRDPGSGERRAYMRYFACGEDLSLRDPGEALPGPVAAGEEPLRVVGAIAGG